MIFGFFSQDKISALARNVAQLIITRYPPVIANNPERPVLQKRVAEILQDAFSSAPQLDQEGPLGLLGRAKLRNVFKWELREIGYEEEFIDFAAKSLIERLIPPI